MKIIDRRNVALGGQSVDRSRKSITTVVWHYTAVARELKRFISQHEQYWKNHHGWDRGGYHFYIDADANIYQNYNYERVTYGVAYNNSYTVHISVEANSKGNYSKAQIEARDWLTRKILADLNLPASAIKGHWEVYNNTACPGYTKAEMDEWRASLARPAGPTAPIAKQEQTKTIQELAKEVIRGAWGNGKERIDRLTAAGYIAKDVQAEVDRIKGKVTVPTATKGTFKFKVKQPVLDEPNRDARKVETYYPGETVNFEDKIQKDGVEYLVYTVGSKKYYVPCGHYDATFGVFV